MNRTVARLNIEHFKRLLGKETTRPSGRPSSGCLRSRRRSCRRVRSRRMKGFRPEGLRASLEMRRVARSARRPTSLLHTLLLEPTMRGWPK
jgi:hypothetical protein